MNMSSKPFQAIINSAKTGDGDGKFLYPTLKKATEYVQEKRAETLKWKPVSNQSTTH
jgi:hypothetical protein